MVRIAISVVIAALAAQRLDEEGGAARVCRLGGSVMRNELHPIRPIIRVTLADCAVKDDDLRVLLQFRQLREASLSHNPITDKGVKHCAKVKCLAYLNLNCTNVSNACTEDLSTMTALESLALGDVAINDDGLRNLARLTLKSLMVSGSEISDDGLKHLAKMDTLEELSVGGTKITDRGLEHLYQLKRLLFLSVIDTKVTDEGIKKLKMRLPKCGVVH